MSLDQLRAGRGERCVSDLALDRLLVGELDRAEASQIRDHVDGCGACAARLAEFDAAAASLPDVPWRRPTLPPAPWWRRTLWPTVTLAAAAAAVVLLVTRPPRDEGGTRAKGGTSSRLHVGHAGRVRVARAGEVVAPGDVLQLTYTSEEPVYIAVIAQDGAGAVQLYFPDDGTRGWRGEPGSDVPLPRSTILDDVLGREVLHVISCPTPVKVDSLTAQIAAGRLPRAPDCRIDVFTMEKRAQ